MLHAIVYSCHSVSTDLGNSVYMNSSVYLKKKKFQKLGDDYWYKAILLRTLIFDAVMNSPNHNPPPALIVPLPSTVISDSQLDSLLMFR
jgi:hypothetical protein